MRYELFIPPGKKHICATIAPILLFIMFMIMKKKKAVKFPVRYVFQKVRGMECLSQHTWQAAIQWQGLILMGCFVLPVLIPVVEVLF